MNAKQLERASYLAAHAVLSANISAPQLATPGARRSYTIDAIANQIRRVFELHCSAFDETGDRHAPLAREDDREQLGETASVGSNGDKRQRIMQKLH